MKKSFLKESYGFSLLELMVVIAIIAILATLTIPSNDKKIIKTNLKETVKLVNDYKTQISYYYLQRGEFPVDNAMAGLPDPEQIKGNFLESVYLIDGAMHLKLGQKISKRLSSKIITVRPIFVPGSENAPISWLCGYAKPPVGMLAAGENKTNIDSALLPLDCR